MLLCLVVEPTRAPVVSRGTAEALVTVVSEVWAGAPGEVGACVAPLLAGLEATVPVEPAVGVGLESGAASSPGLGARGGGGGGRTPGLIIEGASRGLENVKEGVKAILAAGTEVALLLPLSPEAETVAEKPPGGEERTGMDLVVAVEERAPG